MKNYILFIFLFGYAIANAQNCNPIESNRIEIQNIQPPNNFICHIVVHRRKDWNATVSFVSKNVIVGAGHSFNEGFFHTKIRGITIYVGQRNENGTNTWDLKKAFKRNELNIFIPREFKMKSNPTYDFAFVALPENIVDDFYKLDMYENIKNNIDSIYINGYPGDKGDTALWTKKCNKNDVDFTEPLVYKYSLYTFTGDSGAPIWTKDENNIYLIGIHGTGKYKNGSCNAGIKFTDNRIVNLRTFIADNKH